jgi:hypothetical protein
LDERTNLIRRKAIRNIGFTFTPVSALSKSSNPARAIHTHTDTHQHQEYEARHGQCGAGPRPIAPTNSSGRPPRSPVSRDLHLLRRTIRSVLSVGSPTSSTACLPSSCFFVSPPNSVVSQQKIRTTHEAIAVGNPLGSDGLCGPGLRRGALVRPLVGCARRWGLAMAEGRRYAIALQLGQRSPPPSRGIWGISWLEGEFGGWVGSTHRSFFGLSRVSHVLTRAWFRESPWSWWAVQTWRISWLLWRRVAWDLPVWCLREWRR